MVPRKYLVLLSLSGLVVALDQFSKNAIVSAFKLGDSLHVIPGLFSLSRVHNTGAAFGLLATLPAHLHDPFFLLVPALTLAVILIVFYRLRDNQSLSVYALAAIVGGALGNIADRVRLGYVVDFLDFHWSFRWHFPAFNIADAAITIGVLLLLLGMLFEREPAGPPRSVV